MPRQPDTSTPRRRTGTRITWDGATVEQHPAGPPPVRRPGRSGARDPECGYTFDDSTCTERGEHLCGPRVVKVDGFFRDVLVHTKGAWARKPFVLAGWQLDEIIAPLFGTVVWDPAWQRYVRRYRVCWIELARKQGKTELLAGIVLYLLVADDEEGAEIYGCARDRDQARKVYDVAERMVKLSPLLSRRLKIYQQAKRIIDERAGSYYEIISGDSAGALGHNPSGIAFDEIISQRDDSLWVAMRTAMGTRVQPMMVAATTAGDDETSFAATMHAEMQRIVDDPERARHVLVVMRNTPRDADPWDEANWTYANPALGSFLSVQALRDEATEARNDPTKENAFRQFRLNQWVSQSSRWLPLHLWDNASGNIWLHPDNGRQALAGRVAYAGMDLAAKLDLTAWCLLVPDDVDNPDAPVHALWRFWLPEAALEKLDKLHNGAPSQWARAGWLTVIEGQVIDYDRIVADVAADAAVFRIAALDCDEWSMWPVINRVADACGLDTDGDAVTAYKNSYDRMSPGMDDLMGLVRTGRLRHHGNPVARWCVDAVEVRRAAYDANLIRPIKPDRLASRSRIDAVPTAAMACNAMRARLTAPPPRRSAYEDGSLMVV